MFLVEPLLLRLLLGTSGLTVGVLLSSNPNLPDLESILMQPPRARRQDLTEEIHGLKVHDPYRWLEDSTSAETREFVSRQNTWTEQVLESAPVDRAMLRRRIEQLLTIGRVEPPAVGGNRFFYLRRDGRQNQPILYVREGVNGADRVLLDVNALAADGTVALDWFYPSHDGRYLAYGTSSHGSEISTLQILETGSGRLLPEEIQRTRAASLAWLPDSSGFYYTRYPRPGQVPPGEEVYHRHVFFHALGNSAGSNGLRDPQIFGGDLDPQHWPSVHLSEDGRWLLISVEEGWAKTELFLKDLADASSQFVEVTSGKQFLYAAEVFRGELYITTNEDAPRFRVLKASCAHPERANWKEIISQSEAVIEGTQLIGARLFVRYTRNAASELRIYALDGSAVAEVAVPALGSIFAALGGNWDSQQAFLGFTSFAIPPSVYQVSFEGELQPWAQVDSPIDPAGFDTKQVWFTSKDGTCVPMFLVHRNGFTPDGRTPTLLSGYGGFNVGRMPVFNRNAMLLLLEHDGIYADVQLRGGNEFGEEWHRAGMLEKKQNVFDDFIAAAEYLTSHGITDTDHLAIQGGSNGGLLMGAVMTQRPDLFRAVVCQVPLLDMLRYQNFQIAKLWIPEYGSAKDPGQFEYLYAYSPYHRVRQGVLYPATLFMTADTDTRVDPMHAKKMAAQLQALAANGDDRPILLRIDTKAGHGVGKPITKLVDDAADFWTFLFWQLEIA
jgi:prolyl oligopeptidase